MSLLVNNSLTIRQYYHNYRSLVPTSARAEATVGTLSFADSQALRNSIKRLGDYNFEDSTDDDLKEKLKAFQDIYNNTLKSASKYSKTDDSIKKAVANIKQLSEKNKNELSKYGISFDDHGYMDISDSAVTNITHSKFEKILGKESEYMKDLYKCAKRITNRVDIKL